MGVDHRGENIRMAEQLLHGADVISARNGYDRAPDPATSAEVEKKRRFLQYHLPY
jgi:hypothetical protein